MIPEDAPQGSADRSHALAAAARFFAGGGVMRWQLGLTLGDVVLYADGTGRWAPPDEPALYALDRPKPWHVCYGAVIYLGDSAVPHLLHLPRPREEVLMVLAGLLAEHEWALPADPCTWSPAVLAPVWTYLPFEIVLADADFAPASTPAEALRLCVEDVRAAQTAEVQAQVGALAQWLCAARCLSGEAIAAWLASWTPGRAGCGLLANP